MKEWLIKTFVGRMNSKTGMAVIKWYQDYLLRKTVRHASQNSPFYRRKFKELGLSPSMIRRQEDLPKLGFFTVPADIQADPFDFLAVPRAKIVYIMSTSGTTGKPKLTFYTKEDWNSLVSRIVVGFVLMDVGEETVHQIMNASGRPQWMGGTLLASGLERRGCMIVNMGNTPSPKDQVEAMQFYGSTFLYGTPSYLHRVTVEGKKFADLKSLGIRRIYLGAEPMSPRFRQYLQQEWGAEVYDGYGMMEMGAGIGGECPEQNGIHTDPSVVVEVINPETLEPVPVGEVGEMVFCRVGRAATPLLRYRSGDLGRLMPNEPCPCGQLPTRKISNPLGRTDDMLFLGTGENFYPSTLDKVMVGIPGVISYQMVVSENEYKDILQLRVETHSPSPELATRIKQKLYNDVPFIHHDVTQSMTIEEPTVEFLAPGTLLKESPVKLRKVVDLRD
jgi:phenylacetate-CoA ligase